MSDGILALAPLGRQWPTLDPFLFCVHHDDAYPPGDEAMGIGAGQLAGRRIGSDFSGADGWSMYHGDRVPGFPRHPHRGFETVTLARRGYIDHSDSLGACARFGQGDVQWMTAGGGVVHAEMFPLVRSGAPNPTELFQIWLNLPAGDKFAEAYFTMLWSESLPRLRYGDPDGARVEVVAVVGALDGRRPPAAPPDSWASREEADVAIWTLRFSPGARWTVPPAAGAQSARVLYFFAGQDLEVAGQAVDRYQAIQVDAAAPVEVVNGATPAELLMLQGRPIGEPVVQHGPFVMNERSQIEQAIADYRHTGFGGWPWPEDGPVHARESGRFARHADGRIERPPGGGDRGS